MSVKLRNMFTVALHGTIDRDKARTETFLHNFLRVGFPAEGGNRFAKISAIKA